LTSRALSLAAVRARQNGMCTVVIRRSHHIACLAAYLRPLAEQGLLVVLTCSDPTAAGVAPHGGRREVLTPNPLGAAWPTDKGPVILDVSMSITTNGLTKRLRAEGRKFPGVWAVDANGSPTDDPARVLTDPPGALLPMGGLDHGHKGYALALLVEALTGGLAGHGRADAAEGWTATVCAQVFEPALFGGLDAFTRQTSWLAGCRARPLCSVARSNSPEALTCIPASFPRSLRGRRNSTSRLPRLPRSHKSTTPNLTRSRRRRPKQSVT
jgi:LDH2 family malate/lactate/ureidoglycolate dehydrogenase